MLDCLHASEMYPHIFLCSGSSLSGHQHSSLLLQGESICPLLLEVHAALQLVEVRTVFLVVQSKGHENEPRVYDQACMVPVAASNHAVQHSHKPLQLQLRHAAGKATAQGTATPLDCQQWTNASLA